MSTGSPADLSVQREGSSGGVCECCGHESRSIWGFINDAEGTFAAYFVHWTVGHLNDHAANLDFIIGRWGGDATNADRTVVSLLYKLVDGEPQVMVVDANLQRLGSLAATGLKRGEVIGSPLASQIFDLVDAVCVQDERVFAA